ncbi:MAG: tetratricopeptide repeat protein, partial [Anaerolineae bacterium]|nr:tetratricopeptide repeat protein [Anaerolineae bacterium]
VKTPTEASELPQTPGIIPTTPTPYPRLPNPTPTLTGSTLPESISLTDFTYVDQSERWNYCGPATLAMALNYWGWTGNRDDIARIVKPGVQDPRLDFIQRGKWDKNVMPYELADYVRDNTEFDAIIRYGGEIDLVKRLIAAGLPVVIEKGYYERDYTGKVGWLGHYAFTTGYDEKAGVFIYQETYPPKGESGKDRTIQYDVFREGWRGFNYLFLVVFPPEREAEVSNLLGPWNDSTWANQHALEIANAEVQTLSDNERFFALFNEGTSHVSLQQYFEAAEAYDLAFSVYARLDQNEKTRPYRIMWYQTGPYWAYYYSGRYQDVIDLANTTLNETIADPTLEESLYWRGLAQYALGDLESAIADLREAVRLNPNFEPGITKLQEWGVSK